MNKSLTLDALRPGENAVIRGYNDYASEAGYLLEMGLLVGTPVQLIKYAPLGDPIQIRFRGYHLSIRRSLAQAILIEKQDH